MDQLLLGIDVGTTAVKAALFTLDGRLEAVHGCTYKTDYLQANWVEQQPNYWWEAACTAIHHVLKAIPDARDRVLGLAVSAQAPTLLALDRAGQPIRPALIWMDRRAEAEVRELADQLGRDEIYRITGNRVDAFYVASKLRWLRNHEPDTLRTAHQFVQINGYLNYRLTGEYSLDEAHAALLQLRDYRSGEWSMPLCEACGVDPRQFPPILPAHHLHGTVTAQAAEATGLRVGTPVYVGTVDGVAAAVEAGAIQPGVVAEMTGTSTVFIMPTVTPSTDPAFIALPHAIPESYLLLGAMVASGASLNWYRDQFGLVEQQAAQILDENVFDLLTRQAANAPAGSGKVIFLPYMMGERAPIWNSNARGVLFGLSLTTTRGAIIRAILEGTVYALRHNIEVAVQAGNTITELRSVGGGTKSTVWNQLKADILGIPVRLPEASVGAPFGDAVIVGLGAGVYQDVRRDVQNMVRIKTTYEPNQATRRLYNDLYHAYRRLYDSLISEFDHLAGISNDV
ncbi:MAG: FGGY-family carbohydrate kinase [Anaerolineae bacterium]|nr:FGGY-family carbohydrate kinase [Anaerolineae bacterium]